MRRQVSHRNRQRSWLATGLGVALLLGLLAPVAAAGKEKRGAKEEEQIARLTPEQRSWLESVEFIISDEEREAFLALEKDYQRDAFIEQFWRVRDPYPDTARNEFKDRYERMVEEARLLFGGLSEERAEMLLLVGPPDSRIEVRCNILWPIEVWFYGGTQGFGEAFALIFYSRWGGGRFRIWRPSDGVRELIEFPNPMTPDGVLVREIANSCPSQEVDALLAALRLAFNLGEFGFETMLHRLQQPPPPASEEWVATFNAYTTDLPEDAATFTASLELAFPGRHQSRTVVQAILAVAVAEIGVSQLAGHEGYNLVLTGEVLREQKLFDNFRYRFNLAVAEVEGEKIPLVFERYLRPGDYSLVLKLEDLNSGRFFRLERGISVPATEEAPPPPPQDAETARLLAEANAAITSGENTIQIVEPQGELLTGMVRFDTLTTGHDIAEVVFSLDGRQVLRKNRPPFSVEFDLGSLPQMRNLVATAYDSNGDEVARDELDLNAGSHRFAVRLIEPRPNKRYRDSLRAEAEVTVPEGESIARVEFYLNETPVASLYQPPFVQPILLPPDEQIGYIRAVAYQPDGNSTEDVVFVNAPDFMEEVEVQFVELYITVVDRSQRPVQGLTVSDFTVLEDAVEQEPVRFDTVSNLPIHAGIVLDVSASMAERLETAQRAAVSFLEQAITPRDRATLITFNDHPHLAVKFTNDLKILAGGLAGLKAERGTALYDSLIFSLYYFNGVKGQRAIILLSDGKDESSRFDFDQCLEYARRTGVAIYSIGLDLSRGDRGARKGLKELADETGGRSFFIESVEELPSIYAAIEEELRSRYYLAYQSNNTSDDDRFRTIEVSLRSGLEAKTLRGYYP